MGTTTFTGPVRSGPILDTTGTTVGVDIANVGRAVLAQTFPITQAGTGPTTIALPAGATIVSVNIAATVAWGAAIEIGVVDAASNYTKLGTAITPVIGLNAVTPSTLAETAVWQATPADVLVLFSNLAAGAGEGQLVVTYVQN